MDASVYQTLITVLGGLALAWMQREHAKELKEIKIITKETRAAGNSLLGNALEMSAIALERLASRDHNEGDIAAAAAARKNYDVHMEKQAVIEAERVEDKEDC